MTRVIFSTVLTSSVRSALFRSGHARAHTRDGRAVRPTDMAPHDNLEVGHDLWQGNLRLLLLRHWP